MSIEKKVRNGLVGGIAALMVVGSPSFSSAKTMERIILERAAQSRTVMFGDYHHAKKDNEFVIKMLPELKKLGYTTLVVEFDVSFDRLLQKYARGQVSDAEIDRKMPHIEYKSGKKMIREAGRLGMKVRAFDQIYRPTRPKNFCEMVNYRDTRAFNRVKREVLDKNPKEKVVFFYGYSHIDERKNRPRKFDTCTITALGHYLQKYSGRNLSVGLGPGKDFKYQDVRVDIMHDITPLY